MTLPTEIRAREAALKPWQMPDFVAVGRFYHPPYRSGSVVTLLRRLHVHLWQRTRPDPQCEVLRLIDRSIDLAKRQGAQTAREAASIHCGHELDDKRWADYEAFFIKRWY